MVAKTTTRMPMPIQMRAKQFAMFDALKGLTEAIAEKEHENIQRNELAEDRIQELNEELSKLKCGDTVTINYYCEYGKQYKSATGKLRRIDSFWHEIQIEDTTINFSEINSISVAINST